MKGCFIYIYIYMPYDVLKVLKDEVSSMIFFNFKCAFQSSIRKRRFPVWRLCGYFHLKANSEFYSETSI